MYVSVSRSKHDLSSCMALQEVLKQLPGELAAQEEHVREMGKVLKARRGLWRCTRSTMVGAYLQHCVLPRVTYSPADAAFCAAFMRRLIELSVPWFPCLPVPGCGEWHVLIEYHTYRCLLHFRFWLCHRS